MRRAATPWMLALLPLVATASAQTLTKQALKEAWEAQWSCVSDLEVAYWFINEATPETRAAGLIEDLNIVFRWTAARWWWSAAMPDSNEPACALSFDYATRRQRLLYRDDGRPYGRIETRVSAYRLGMVWLERAMSPPDPDDRSASLSALLDSDESVLRPELEVVDDRQAAVLDVFSPPDDGNSPPQLVKSVWLDVERHAVPLKEELYNVNDGSPILTIWQRDYVQIDGVWLPTRIESLVYVYTPGVVTHLSSPATPTETRGSASTAV